MGVFDVKLESPIEDLLVCSDADVGELLELDEVVGKGGFATVWRAAFNGQLCACKVLQPRGGTLPPAPIVRLFIRECMSLMLIEHSAIIRCAGLIRMRMDDFPELGLTYDTYGMLLEFCEGGTLKDLLLAQLVYKQDQYALREALSWLAQVASALQQFHNLEMPIIHRDIKPENILLQVGIPSALPGFWQPSQQQQQAGMPRMRLGSGAGGRSFRPRQNLDAKLADLGLGVRVCEKRSVLIRRRAAPIEDSSAAAAAVAGAGAGAEDDATIQVMFGGVSATAAAAAGGLDNLQEGVRTPFMGFTTTPVKPPKRLGSNQRKPSNRHSNGAGGDSAAAIATAAAAAAVVVGSSPGGVGGGGAEAPGSPPRADTLHRAILLNNVRARLSGTRESAAAWGASGEHQALAPAAAAAGGGGFSLAGQHHSGESRLSPPAVAGAARTSAGGSASASVVEAGEGGGGVVGGGNALAAAAAAAASGSDVDISGGARSSAEGPSPFRDFLQQQQQQQQPSKQVPYCSPIIPNSGGTSAGGAAPADAEGLMSRADGAGVGSSPFALSFSQSLGHAMGHGPLEPVLSPISERSISADDTLNLGSDCRSCSETLQGSGTLQGSNTVTSSGNHVLPLLQPSSSRPPSALSRKEQIQMLQTIQEPSDETGTLLSSVSSAPATPGAHHRLQIRSDPQCPTPPRSPPLTRRQLPVEQSSPSRGSRLAAAAAASVRQSLRRAAVTAAAVAGVLSPRSSVAGNVPRVDVQDGVAAAPTLNPGGSGGGDRDGESASPLPAAKSIPNHLSNIDLAAHLESRNPQQPQQLQQQSSHQPDHQLQPQRPHHQPQPQHHQQRHGPAHSAADLNNPQTQTATTTTQPTMNPNNPTPGGAPSQHPLPPMAATAGYGSRGSRVNTGISVTAATAASGMPGAPQLPRGETMTASASASATITGTVTVTLSRGPSRDRVGLMGLSSLVRPTLRELRHSESLTRAMRRVGSLLRSLKLPSLPKFRRNSQFQWVYGLTGQAGSCMYMAPEVFRGEPYNEKVDVYSFGVMMYELLARDMLLVRYIGGTRAGAELGVRDPHQYAKKVCEGFRPPRHLRIPEAQWQLIQACWHPDPVVRPDMAEVVAHLESALANLDSQQAGPHTKEAPDSHTAHKQQQQQQQTPRGRRSSDGGDLPPSSPRRQQKQKKKTQEEGCGPGG
ncbi:hypothetical protein Vafri_10566, partial [Volvox africanus]